MLDIKFEKLEKLFPLREAPDHLPRRSGRKCHLASVYRWVKGGLSGVRLETLYIGGTQYTSEEALGRFFQRVTEAKSGLPSAPASSKRSNAAHERAMRELQEAGI